MAMSEEVKRSLSSVSQVTHGSAQHSSGRDKGFITSRDRQTSPHLNGREETHHRISLMREPAAFCNFLSAPTDLYTQETMNALWFGPVSRLLLGLRLCLLQCGTRMASQGLRLRLLFRARRVQCMSVPGILSCPEIPIIPGLYGISPKIMFVASVLSSTVVGVVVLPGIPSLET